MNHLELVWRSTTVRLGASAEVETLEFVVDGQPLSDWIRYTAGEEFAAHTSGCVSVIGSCFVEGYVEDMHRRLMGEAPPELPGERVPLLVCPCGDPYCGGVSARVSHREFHIIWSRFGTMEESFPGMPELCFDREQLRVALGPAKVFSTRRGRPSREPTLTARRVR